MNSSSAAYPVRLKNRSDIDGGFAWIVLTATLLNLAIAIGTTYCTSIFMVEWMESFAGNQETVSWIGSINMALVFGAAPVSSCLSNRFGHRVVVMTGGVVSTMGYVATAFSNNISTIYFTYGIVTGFGISLVFCPTTIFVGYYFNKRMSLAMCLSSLGGAIGMMGFAPLYRVLIRHYGWRGACMLTGGVVLQITVFGALFIPPRVWNIKKSEKTESSTNFDMRLLKDYQTILLTISYLLWTMGSIVFFIFIVDFCIHNGLSKDYAAYVISASAACSIAGRLLLSLISICVPNLPGLEILALFCLFCGMSLIILTANNNVMYISVMCSFIHLFYGGIIAMIGLAAVQVFGITRATSAFGYLNVGCGIGGLIGPPIAGFLYVQRNSYTVPFYFGGVSLMASAGVSLVIVIRNCLRRPTAVLVCTGAIGNGAPCVHDDVGTPNGMA